MSWDFGFSLVIMILVDIANGKQRHVPYRDSKLTFLLQVLPQQSFSSYDFFLKVLLDRLFKETEYDTDDFLLVLQTSLFKVDLFCNLQDSLGGNSKTTVIATISPSNVYVS
jgi:hypothetical protein